MKKLLFIFVGLLLFSCKGDSVEVQSGDGSGRGGSMARFTIVGDYLYLVDNQSLVSFNIKNEDNPTYGAKTPISAFTETIFPFKNNLLVGTQTGMQIFGLSNPISPNQISVYQHVTSCDPVVADGNVAYVTLRSGTACNRGQNLLDVIDISQMQSPLQIGSYPMQNPHGLGVRGKLLFVCEGDNGLKVFDKSNHRSLKLLHTIEDVKSFDVIPLSNHLIVTGKDGISQYEYTEDGKMNLLSQLTIEK